MFSGVQGDAYWRPHLSPVKLQGRPQKLGECMVCKAKRLQQESEEDFRRRYPMVVLRPQGMGFLR